MGGYIISVCNQPTRSTQPSTLHGTVKWVSAFGLSNTNKWWWWLVSVDSGSLYRRTHSLSRWIGLGSAAAWHRCTFIKWTGWTLAMALPWWQHDKYWALSNFNPTRGFDFAYWNTHYPTLLNVISLFTPKTPIPFFLYLPHKRTLFKSIIFKKTASYTITEACSKWYRAGYRRFIYYVLSNFHHHHHHWQIWTKA